MQLDMVGLGRMGANMVRRLMGGGHQWVVFDSADLVTLVRCQITATSGRQKRRML